MPTLQVEHPNIDQLTTEVLQLAVQHHQANRLDQAEQIYRQVLEKQPEHPEALYRLGLLVQQLGQIEEAEKFFNAALQVQPKLVKAWFSLGNLYQAQGQLTAAEAAYRQALAQKPNLVAIHNNLGYTLQQQGSFDEAVICYQKALELQPNCAEVEVNLGNTLNAQGQLSSEQQTYYATLNNQLGIACQKAGDLKTAVVYYQQALAQKPDLVDAHYNLGVVLQKLGKWDSAIASYEKALEINPHNWFVYTCLGQIYQAQNNREQAAAIYRQGLTLLNPHYAQAVAADQSCTIQITPPIPQTEVTVGAYQFPAIPPVTEPDQPRPFWSVVIPVYNRTDYLLECLASVLVQWPGETEMEILVMDNASTTPLFELVNAIGRGIIRYYRHPQNIGALPNHNAGIALSRGQWIHIIHDDDCVLPGFYSHLNRSLEECSDHIGAAFTGFEYFNEKGDVVEKGEVLSWFGERRGIPQNFLRQIGVTCPLQVPAVVIRRATYELLGGYYPDLVCAPDWELYKRIAVSYDWWYEPGSLARYRVHSHRMTADDLSSGILAASLRLAVEISESYLPADLCSEVTAQARSYNFNYCLKRVAIPLKAGNLAGTLRMLQEMLKLYRSPQAVAKLFAWLTQDEAAPLREEIVSKLLLTPVNNTQNSIDTEQKYLKSAIQS